MATTYPTQFVVTDMGQGLIAEIADDAGAVDFVVYEHLYTTRGEPDQPKVLKRIHLTKDDVDTLITAIQTTSDE